MTKRITRKAERESLAQVLRGMPEAAPNEDEESIAQRIKGGLLAIVDEPTGAVFAGYVRPDDVQAIWWVGPNGHVGLMDALRGFVAEVLRLHGDAARRWRFHGDTISRAFADWWVMNVRPATSPDPADDIVALRPSINNPRYVYGESTIGQVAGIFGL